MTPLRLFEWVLAITAGAFGAVAVVIALAIVVAFVASGVSIAVNAWKYRGK